MVEICAHKKHPVKYDIIFVIIDTRHKVNSPL